MEPNWQLFGKMGIINEHLGALMPSLSLTLNPEPVNGYGQVLPLRKYLKKSLPRP